MIDERARPRPRRPRAHRDERPHERRRRTLALGAIAFVLLLVVALRDHGKAPLRAPVRQPAARPATAGLDGYDPARATRYVSRAISGEEDPLFSASPGGALATAARVDRLRATIDRAAAAGGIDPAVLEGLVFVESAGRADATAGAGPSGATGLTQILPGTATAMLGLHVDLTQSVQLTQAIASARTGGATPAAIHRLEARRAAADERFDPAAELAATVRYLRTAESRFGREDLAVAAYHMGLGNLSRILSDFNGGTSVPYAQLFFGTGPARHRSAYLALSGLSDQSSLYLWRVLGAAALMRLYRTDRPALARLETLEDGLGSGAEVLHPPAATPVFADAQALADAYASRTLVALPANLRSFGVAVTPSVSAAARAVSMPVGLLLGLRPAAATVLEALAMRVHALRPSAPPLRLTSAVTDRAVQSRLDTNDPPSGAGWSFTLARPASTAQAAAVADVLGRMQALDVVAVTDYPSEIEVTASSDAARVLADGP